jgi:hypothetical protein
VVAFAGAEKTTAFKNAKKLADKGVVKIISEDEFFDLLNQ